ncbi:J domain-containing protein [Candidatus Magnetaquicoccus inordinatus]|uniref:J domain-containing protein n=1 Tax=Candidatus Magnetaquicoccus inordinatus TaxID=2496818 RepID=UPI00102CEFDF|nr:J domain-containing protein [Candidatus Magnetaquicoccus inordinatus]
MNTPGLFARITEAREILGIGEEATLSEINARIKILLKRWHPDCCHEEVEHSTEQTRRIIESAATLRAYCAHYRFSFREDEVEKYLPPEEWWRSRFGNDPVWNSEGKERANGHDRSGSAMGKQR